MEDNYYYKLRAIQADLAWLEKEIKQNGFANIIISDSKRREFRKLVSESGRCISSINSKLGEEFTQELGGVPVLPPD